MWDILGIQKSKLRRDLFALWFANVDKKFYVRQLERLLNFSAGNLRKELKGLESNDIIYSRKEANLVYYFLNKKHPLFKEIKSIVFKTIGVEEILRHELKKITGIEMAFIYGSFAKGEESSASDIDLFIIGNPDENKLVEIIRKIEDKLDREINYSLYGKEDFKNKKKEKEPFIMDLIKNKKVFLAGDINEL